MICDNCINLEIFGKPGVDEYFNKCALLDIWNLSEGEECEHYEAIPDLPDIDKLADWDNSECVII